MFNPWLNTHERLNFSWKGIKREWDYFTCHLIIKKLIKIRNYHLKFLISNSDVAQRVLSDSSIKKKGPGSN